MTLAEDLTLKVREFVSDRWGAIPDGYVIPSAESLTFRNTGVRIDATVLYSDIRNSTDMVNAIADTLAAEY